MSENQGQQSSTFGESSGFTLWLTGPPGAGKSTLALLLRDALSAQGLKVTLLDGDIIREQISADLGFSKADRDEQVRRVSELAVRNTSHGHATIAALVSPYRRARELARGLFRPGAFIEVHCHCPLQVLIERDPKGMYARALAGEIRQFTGIDDPYEAPSNPEARVDTDVQMPSESLQVILGVLIERGHIQGTGS